MKNYLLPIFALLIVGCGNQCQQQVANTQSIETGTTNATAERSMTKNDIKALQDSTSNIAGGESLNDIRFGNWTEKDWCDNDYFRALRKYIDTYLQGNIENKDLNPYKSILKSKFVIYTVEPFIVGGLFVSILFLDEPNTIFDAWIYSDVDETTRVVTDYRVKGFKARKDEYSEMMKDDVLATIKEHPENKLW